MDSQSFSLGLEASSYLTVPYTFHKPNISKTFSARQVCLTQNPHLHLWFHPFIWSVMALLFRQQTLSGSCTSHITIIGKLSNEFYRWYPSSWPSPSGFYVYLGLNVVSWSSHKQKVVSRSSTEAEYRSIVAALADIKWITSLLRELRIAFSVPKIYSDNLGATL
ncbi:uncharacterized protein LOC108328945 [Vigna angularis]|uniref:uncharacterized protein LOC108328945 n=1 Tax=Phaseolus angularis TaxID=3914 RepID=UPI000809C916|nr:uncharacterized protein LOC108328945 [Vigna angularis]